MCAKNTILVWIWLLLPPIVLGDNLALLSGTLRTYQKAACEYEWLFLSCPGGTTISIQFAQYARVTSHSRKICHGPQEGRSPRLTSPGHPGHTCVWPPAFQYALLQKVVGLCQKQPNCKFQTSPETFAIDAADLESTTLGKDPCPGTRKFIEVAYKCRPSEFRNLIGCDGEIIQLKCNATMRIAIYSASYGRTEYESVRCPQPNGVAEETCLASYATETVMQLCHGKRRCHLSVDAETFTNPCKFPLSRKYIKIIYTCLPRKVLKDRYQGELEDDEDEEEEEEYPEENVQSDLREDTTAGKYPPESSNFLEGGYEKSSSAAEEDLTGSPMVFNSGETPPPDEDGTLTPGSKRGVQMVNLISQGIAAYYYITENSDKFYFYMALCLTLCFLVLLLLILTRVALTRSQKKAKKSSKVDSNGDFGLNGNSMALFPDRTDELGLFSSPEIDDDGGSSTGRDGFDLVSILKRPPEETGGFGCRAFDNYDRSRSPKPSSGSTFNSGNRIVRFSNSSPAKSAKNKRSSGLYSPDLTPKSLRGELTDPSSSKDKRNSQNNLHFFYDG